MLSTSSSLADLIVRTAQSGRITWIGVRPARREPMRIVDTASLSESGLSGDRSKQGKRAVTLLQAEHLPVIASFLGLASVDPGDLRRNVLVAGINLLSLRDRRVRIGNATIFITGPCAPCSRMEEAFGHGGYAAVRGHGGVTAEVLEPGEIANGSPLRPIG